MNDDPITPLWIIRDHEATLSAAGMQATVSLLRPHAGWRVAQTRIDPARATRLEHLIGVQLAGHEAARDEQLVDRFARGGDVVATYELTSSRLRPQIYWRLLDSHRPTACGLEVIVSVQTELLECWPATTTETRIAAEEIVFLQAAVQPEWHALADAPAPFRTDATGAAGAFLVRPPGAQFSYLEMVHESDFCGATVEWAGTEATIGFKMFPEFLEKGVIRRGRIRGLLLPRDDDRSAAIELYRQFRSSDPPLTV